MAANSAATTVSAFAAYLRQNAPEVRDFSAEEFFVKGGSNATNHLNTDPPRELWPNVIALAKLLQKLRDRLGVPITFNSVYRSPAYNRAVGGAPGSQHMQFKAADIVIHAPGTKPAVWAATLRAMRAAGEFKGGVGAYAGFVHVDVRGTNADFDQIDVSRGRVLPAVPRQPDEPPRTAPPATGNGLPPEVAVVVPAAGGVAVGAAAGQVWPLIVGGVIALVILVIVLSNRSQKGKR